MQAIHKYSIELMGGTQVVEIPEGGRVVKVAPQNGKICIWALVSLAITVPKVPCKFTVLGTGHPIPEGAAYFGTVFMDEFVWHIFRLEE